MLLAVALSKSLAEEQKRQRDSLAEFLPPEEVAALASTNSVTLTGDENVKDAFSILMSPAPALSQIKKGGKKRRGPRYISFHNCTVLPLHMYNTVCHRTP